MLLPRMTTALNVIDAWPWRRSFAIERSTLNEASNAHAIVKKRKIEKYMRTYQVPPVTLNGHFVAIVPLDENEMKKNDNIFSFHVEHTRALILSVCVCTCGWVCIGRCAHFVVNF